jgi:methyltransferase
MVSGGVVFVALLAAVALERGAELALSVRNARRAFAHGGLEVEGRGAYATMVGVHALFLPAAAFEAFVLDRPFRPALAAAMAGLVAASMALRWWAIATLGDRWNTRVIVVPGEPAVAAGPYRFLRHPNYVAVTVEMFAIPLVHTAWGTALVWSVASALLLARRIPLEERALELYNDYRARLGDRRRFLPGAGGPG